MLQPTKVNAKARAKTNAISLFMLKPPFAVQKIHITFQYDYTIQSTNFSIPVSIQICNFSMNAALFRRFACRPAAFLVVWGGQTEREPPLADFKLHAARVRVCVGLAAALRVFCPANAVSRYEQRTCRYCIIHGAGGHRRDGLYQNHRLRSLVCWNAAG